MDKNLEFLTKPLVDAAVALIEKNGIPPKREGKGYAVSINEEQYPFKLIVTEAAKIAGINLTSNDFSSNKANRNGFEKLTNYAILSFGAEMEYSKFKKLLEYFVAHLEWVVTNDEKNIGFEEYILPLINNNKFKRSGQGYGGANIQLQIKDWQSYTNGEICINVQANFGDYKSAKSYLNWRGTGLNIIANWSHSKIISLYQEEYLHWKKNPTRKKFGKEITLSNLGLFDKKDTVTSDLINFFESFETSIINFNKLNANRIMTAKLEPYINLIYYKKQIILQGPPGTGKTRLAKEIAKILIGEEIISKKPSEINNSDIEKYLTVGLEIPSVQEKTIYTIAEITSNNVRLTLTGGKTYSPNFSDIKKWYDNKKWAKKGEQKNQLDPYNAALAKYIYDSIENIELKKDFIKSDQFKLIQFHPSYTYEDFVRGIVSVPNEDSEGVLLKTENKVLAEFAEKALNNKLDSQKGATELSKEKWINEHFEKFIDFISDEIEKNRKVDLTDSVSIIGLDNDAFRYKGIRGWTEKGTRMLFKDIKQAFLNNNTIRQDLKNNINVSRSAYWDATYFIKTVDLFRKFLIDENLTFVVNNNESEVLKNYVLIIDEINRANLSSVLGELIYALEYRNEPVESMYEYNEKREIILPSNLYIIGTMNTADRSVGHIDYAIKRRFAFVNIEPKDLGDEEGIAFDSTLFNQVAKLFDTNLSPEFKKEEVQLGHSYFIDKSKEGGSMSVRFQYEIKPMLDEYIKDGVLIGNDIAQKIDNLTPSI